jgi:dihydrolipoamide dehydrogenase
LLVAVDRAPRTEDLAYAEAGLRLDRGWVTTDERLSTGLEGVYAVGDLVPGLQLAHRGFAHGIFVAEEIARAGPATGPRRDDPPGHLLRAELASVGLTEPQAREQLGVENIEVAEYNRGGNGRSQVLQTAGSIKLVRRKDGPVVGVHMTGSRMGEQVGEAALLVG